MLRTRAYRRFEGLVFSTGEPPDPQRARRALRRAGIDGWRLSRLGRRSPDFFAEPPARARVSVGAAWDLTYRLREDRDVERAEPAFETWGFDEPRRARGIVGEERHLPESEPRDWVLATCGVREAWMQPRAPQGQGVLIAHPDTGYARHPQLAKGSLRTDLGRDFVADRADPRDPLTGYSAGHGTATASVIVSEEDDALCGIAPRAQLVPLRVSDSVIHFSWRRLCAALYWAMEKRLRIASMSLGGPWGGSAALPEAVRRAAEAGLIQVAAAGNYAPFVVYPACLPEVIAVAACNARSQPWQDSSRGAEVDITAPGESVWRALAARARKHSVERSSGTSYATAAVAALCALWLSRHGGFDALAARFGSAGAVGGVFKEALQASARTPGGWDRKAMGAGIAHARRLLERALPAKPPAQGIRIATPRRGPPDAWQRIEAFFPELAPGVVRAALPAQEAVLDELHFHIATDPALRRALRSRFARGSRTLRLRGLAIPGASRQLRSALT